MKVAVLSDIHSNFQAFEAVLEDIDRHSVDRMYFLGDLWGYGGAPEKCLGLFKSAGFSGYVRGNHDEAAYNLLRHGQASAEYKNAVREFKASAKTAVDCNAGMVEPGCREDFKVHFEHSGYRLEEKMGKRKAVLSHGDPIDPAFFQYVTAQFEQYICDIFIFMKHRGGFDLSFLGHSHYPFISEMKDNTLKIYEEECEFTLGMKKDAKCLVNTGSVGQPRDGDPRACWVLLDDESISLKRVEYDIPGAQKDILDTDMPEWVKSPLAERLAIGR